MKPEAILFDVDGVLVDSEAFVAEAAVLMFAELYGAVVRPEEFAPFIGTGEAAYLRGVAGLHGIELDIERAKARTYALYFDVIRGRLKPVRGAVELVRSLGASGLKSAIATSSDRAKLEANLREIGLAPEDFDAVVTGLDVERKKPYPDIYLEAARRIGTAPRVCLVIEDAPEGLRAGRAAGCACVGLSTSFPAEILEAAGARRVLADLRGGIAELAKA